MKQNLRLIFMTLLCAVFSTAWGADVEYKTLTFPDDNSADNKVSSYSSTWTAVIDDDSWTIENFNNNNWNNWTYIKCGNKNDASTGMITTASTIDKALTKVVVTVDAFTAGKVNSTKLEVASDESFSVDLQTINVDIATGDLVYTIPTPTENQYYRLSYDCGTGGKNNGFVTISKVQYIYDDGSAKIDIATLNSISPTTLIEGDLDEFTLNATFVEGLTAGEDYEVNWSSDDTNVLEVADGLYEAKKAGTANVTVSVTVLDDATYNEVSKSFPVTVYPISIPTFSPASGTYKNPKTVTISCETPGTTIYYNVNSDEDPDASSTLYTEAITVSETTTLKAVAIRGNYRSAVATAVYTFSDDAIEINPKNFNSNFFVKVTSDDELEDGDAILIVNEDAQKAMSTNQTNNNRGETSVTITNHLIQDPSANVQKLILVETTEESWYFYDENKRGYLYAASSGSNLLRTEDTPDANAKATIAIADNGDATIVFQGEYTRNTLRYNSSSKLFSCYDSNNNQKSVQIYKEVPTIPVTISNVGYATLYYGEKHLIVPSGVEAYTCNVNEDKTIEHTTTFETGDVIPAGTAVLLHGAADTHSFGESNNAGNKTVGANMLRGHDVATETTGPNGATSGYKFFTLSLNAAGEASSVGFYYMNEGGTAFTSEAHKAYLAVPTSIAGASSYIFDENTGIKSMEAEKQSQEGVYTLSGVRMCSEQLPAGIYIVNGKKMVIK